MADLYGTKGAVGGIFKGTQVQLSVSDGTGAGGLQGALVQRIQIQYRRNVTRIWELGSYDTYYVIGHTEGTASMERIMAKVTSNPLDVLADPCAAQTKSVNLGTTVDSCDTNGSGKGLSISLKGPVLVQRDFSIDVGQFLLTEGAQLMFSSLEKTER